VKPTNYIENRKDRRLGKNQNGKRRVEVVMRERNGRDGAELAALLETAQTQGSAGA
jgi:hypothetical protein